MQQVLIPYTAQVGGHQFYAAVIGIKGDWPYLRKAWLGTFWKAYSIVQLNHLLS